jgi:hypothetical protein
VLCYIQESVPRAQAATLSGAESAIVGRWHDNRHTLVTELAESGAGDEVIMRIAGHVSRAMPVALFHVRMEAKRRALDEIAARQRTADEKRQKEAERQQHLRRSLNQRWFSDRERQNRRCCARTTPSGDYSGRNCMGGIRAQPPDSLQRRHFYGMRTTRQSAATAL